MPIEFLPLTVVHWVYKVVDVNCADLWQGFVDLLVQREEGGPVLSEAMQVQTPGASVACRSGVAFGVPIDFKHPANGACLNADVVRSHCDTEGLRQVCHSSNHVRVEVTVNLFNHNLPGYMHLWTQRDKL